MKISKRNKKTFHSKEYSDGKYPHETKSNIISRQGNVYSNHNKIQLPHIRLAEMTNAAEAMEKRGFSHTVGGNTKRYSHSREKYGSL